MPDTLILAVPGSLRQGSFTTALLRAAVALAPEGVRIEIADVVRDLPLYDQDLDGAEVPATVQAVRDRFAAADGVLIATPEYNYSIPGGLKNWLDWITRPFAAHALLGKRVAVVGASPGKRGGEAPVKYLREILPALGAVIAGDELLIPQVSEHVDVAAGTVSDEIAKALRAQIEAIVAPA